MIALAHGIHDGIPEERYHRKILDIASSSSTKRIAVSPAHLLAWHESTEQEERDPFRLGKAAHAAILEPDRFSLEWQAMPDLSGRQDGKYLEKAGRDRRDGWIADRKAQGLPIIDEKEASQVRGMVASVLAHPKARALLEGGISEATLRWRDRRTGVECKARVDHLDLKYGFAADLKTCEDARPDAFFRDIPRHGYETQDDWYETALAELGSPVPFYFVAVEKQYPHGVCVHQIGERSLAEAHDENARRLELYARCLATNTWPSYPNEIHRRELGWTPYRNRKAA